MTLGYIDTIKKLLRDDEKRRTNEAEGIPLRVPLPNPDMVSRAVILEKKSMELNSREISQELNKLLTEQALKEKQ